MQSPSLVWPTQIFCAMPPMELNPMLKGIETPATLSSQLQR